MQLSEAARAIEFRGLDLRDGRTRTARRRGASWHVRTRPYRPAGASSVVVHAEVHALPARPCYYGRCQAMRRCHHLLLVAATLVPATAGKSDDGTHIQAERGGESHSMSHRGREAETDSGPADLEGACSLNGFLAGGRCVCDKGWTGSDCGALKLGPTADNRVDAGRIYPPSASKTSSWGGGVVQRDGKFHLYVSEMSQHCGLGTWNTNSFIRHAESDTVDGVFTPDSTPVLGVWAHNAMPWLTPDGDISIWHIGDGTPARRPEQTGCANGTTPVSATETHADLAAPAPISRIPYSHSPNGPWKTMNVTCVSSAGAVGPCPIDNPTPVSLTNGTTLLAHRARGGFGLLVAPHWSGPYRNIASGMLNSTNINSPEDEFSCEDGFLFHGQRGGIHLLCHCNGVKGYPWDDHGRVAFSRDGITWRWSKERTFPPALTHPDKTNTSHISRQRPQLVFGPGNVPTQLITGVAAASTNRPYPWQAGCSELDAVSKPCDLTYTAMQPILP